MRVPQIPSQHSHRLSPTYPTHTSLQIELVQLRDDVDTLCFQSNKERRPAFQRGYLHRWWTSVRRRVKSRTADTVEDPSSLDSLSFWDSVVSALSPTSTLCVHQLSFLFYWLRFHDISNFFAFKAQKIVNLSLFLSLLFKYFVYHGVLSLFSPPLLWFSPLFYPQLLLQLRLC